LYLIGYRGCGKSTVGRGLAQRLGLTAVDTDARIEEASGQSIREIFATEGEAGFRDREAAAIAQVAAEQTRTVVSLGGGAILRPANRELLSTTGQCIWLQASAEQLYRRICGDVASAERRPQLSDRGGFAEVVELLAAREPLYRELAQKIVQTEGKTPDEVVAEIVDWVSSFGSGRE
jgi:shikimate kinase